MSNNTNNAFALVALFFLWGLAGHLDQADESTAESSPHVAESVAVEPPSATHLLRLVCIAEPDHSTAKPARANRSLQPHLVSFSAQPHDEWRPSTPVLRCFVDND
jgi:hypothetical protein